jgi:hypothetical protein
MLLSESMVARALVVPGRAGLPNLRDVLANVCRGRAVYICLIREQKRELRDSERRIALDVLRHLLGLAR